MLDHDAPVLHERQPAFGRDLLGLFIADSCLQPHAPRAGGNRLPGHVRARRRPAKYVHHVDLHRDVPDGSITLSPQHFIVLGVHRDHVVAVVDEILPHVARGPLRIVAGTDQGDRLAVEQMLDHLRFAAGMRGRHWTRFTAHRIYPKEVAHRPPSGKNFVYLPTTLQSTEQSWPNAITTRSSASPA